MQREFSMDSNEFNDTDNYHKSSNTDSIFENETAYDETCAGIGNLLFNYRMFLLEQDAKYVDVAEVALFNNILTGVSFSGDKFFYDNPLESYGDKQRSHWFGCACCPTNLARIIPQISGMMYANNSNEIFCGFYTSNSTTISLKNGDVYLKQTSNYPYDENVLIEVTPKNKNQKFTLNMRVPTWAIGEKFVPGALYYYANKSENNKWSISVNGNILKDVKLEKGFVKINRVWEKGDVIKLHLPKKVRFNKAIKEVKADKGRVAITYGPLVYCAESVDNVTSANLLIVSDFNQNTDVHICKNGILKGIELIRLQNANYITKDKIMKKCELNLIPYYAWNNRGVHSMNIWFADSFKSLLENPDINKIINNYEFVKKITATFTNQNDCLNATISNVNPKSSSDKTLKRWTSYNKKTPQSLTYEFKKNLPISEVNVYWYDDNNEVRVPKTWNIEYLDESNKWQKYPLYLTDSYSVLKDQYNVVRTAEKSINTKALRINIKPQDNSSVGILKVQFK